MTKKRITISIDEDLFNKVTDYRFEHRIDSFSNTIEKLLADTFNVKEDKGNLQTYLRNIAKELTECNKYYRDKLMTYDKKEEQGGQVGNPQ